MIDISFTDGYNITLDGYKHCVGTCKCYKHISEFYTKAASLDGYQNICKTCTAEVSKKHYENNKEKIKQRTRDRVKRIKPLARQIALHYLKDGCVDCGEKDIVVLHFDHQRDKKYEIARMINEAYSLDKLEEELQKCEVRCANCHIRKTAKDFNWWRIDINIET